MSASAQISREMGSHYRQRLEVLLVFHLWSLRSLLPSLCPPVSGASAPNSGNGRGALRPPEPSLPAGRKANRARGIWECMSAPGLNQGWMQEHKCCSSCAPDSGVCDLHHFQGSTLALNQSHPPRPISHSWCCTTWPPFLPHPTFHISVSLSCTSLSQGPASGKPT